MKTKIQHTSGPWVVDGSFIQTETRDIAKVGTVSTRTAEDDANALLIAAAPDLLAQLKALAVQLECAGMIVPLGVIQAIAKAEGSEL